MRKHITILILLLIAISSNLRAQGAKEPVHVNTVLTPPYTLNLSDYSKFGSQHLVITLIANDLNLKNVPAKLRITMETMGVTIQTIPTIITTPIYIDGGSTTILFGRDLADYFNINNLTFKGYSKEAYHRTGQLPEGLYKITVEVLHYHTNRPFSNQGTTTAWIAVGKPPELTQPETNAQLGQYKGMPLTFSWLASNVGTPISKGSIQYKFEMWEMRVPGINPNTVAVSTPVFHEHTTFNTLYSLYPVTLLMEPGMTYAWRVTASDVAGLVPFEQNGHSEIRTFTYKALCDSATNFTATSRGTSGKFEWQAADNHTSFNTELRNPKTGWQSNSETFQSSAQFFDLEHEATYEMRVQAVCDGDPANTSDFSDWKTITIPKAKPLADTSCPECSCDKVIPPADLSNTEVKQNLQPGDTIVNNTGTTRFIVKTVEPQGNGTYKGIFLLWAEIWNIKVICKYWDLSVNTENTILHASFESVYDPKFLLDVDAAQAYVNNLLGAVDVLLPDAQIKDTIKLDQPLGAVYVNDNDEIISVTIDESGNINEEVISPNTDNLQDVLLQGNDGNEYVITKDGDIMGKDEYLNTGGSNRKLEDYNKEKEENNLSENTTVEFQKSETQKYGFDAYTEQKTPLQKYYPALNNGYRPAWKSIASHKTDKVTVSAQGENISFRDHMGIEVPAVNGELLLRGSFGGDQSVVYAYYGTDSTKKIVGKLSLASYDEQVNKVYLVPVNGAELPNVDELQEVLNVYKQAITTWQVQELPGINNITFGNTNFTHGGSSNLQAYNTDQKTVIKAFTKNTPFERGAFYLFYVTNVQGKSGDIAGYMPFQRQAGFIYESPRLEVVAHELGHGAFNLRHTFSAEQLVAPERETQNLMDYNNGIELWKHQWDLIQSPEKMLFAWSEGEEETEKATVVNLEVLKGWEYSNLGYPFLTPSGKVLILPLNAKNITFSTGDKASSESGLDIIPFGTIMSFKIDGNTYKAKWNNDSKTFTRYQSESGDFALENHYHIEDFNVPIDKVIVGSPTFVEGEIHYKLFQIDNTFSTAEDLQKEDYTIAGQLETFDFIVNAVTGEEEVREISTPTSLVGNESARQFVEYYHKKLKGKEYDKFYELYIYTHATLLDYYGLLGNCFASGMPGVFMKNFELYNESSSTPVYTTSYGTTSKNNTVTVNPGEDDFELDYKENMQAFKHIMDQWASVNFNYYEAITKFVESFSSLEIPKQLTDENVDDFIRLFNAYDEAQTDNFDCIFSSFDKEKKLQVFLLLFESDFDDWGNKLEKVTNKFFKSLTEEETEYVYSVFKNDPILLHSAYDKLNNLCNGGYISEFIYELVVKWKDSNYNNLSLPADIQAIADKFVNNPSYELSEEEKKFLLRHEKILLIEDVKLRTGTGSDLTLDAYWPTAEDGISIMQSEEVINKYGKLFIEQFNPSLKDANALFADVKKSCPGLDPLEPVLIFISEKDKEELGLVIPVGVYAVPAIMVYWINDAQESRINQFYLRIALDAVAIGLAPFTGGSSLLLFSLEVAIPAMDIVLSAINEQKGVDNVVWNEIYSYWDYTYMAYGAALVGSGLIKSAPSIAQTGRTSVRLIADPKLAYRFTRLKAYKGWTNVKTGVKDFNITKFADEIVRLGDNIIASYGSAYASYGEKIRKLGHSIRINAGLTIAGSLDNLEGFVRAGNRYVIGANDAYVELFTYSYVKNVQTAEKIRYLRNAEYVSDVRYVGTVDNIQYIDEGDEISKLFLVEDVQAENSVYCVTKTELNNGKAGDIDLTGVRKAAGLDDVVDVFEGARKSAIARFGKDAEDLIYVKFNKNGGAAAEIINHYGLEGLNALKKVDNIQDAAKELVNGKTMYRFVNEGTYNFEKLKAEGVIDAAPKEFPIYISLDDLETGAIAKSKLQLPGNVEPTWVAEFEGVQILDDVFFPKAKWTKADYLEVTCRSYPENGAGGGGQFITNSEIQVSKMRNLKTGEVIDFTVIRKTYSEFSVNKIFKDHIFKGEIKKIVKEGNTQPTFSVSGVHHSSAVDNVNVRISEKSVPDANGVYTAKVEMYHQDLKPINGTGWKKKGSLSTFFPDSWNHEKVLIEISHAMENKMLVAGFANKYRGTTSNGITIEMFINNGILDTAYPIKIK